MAARDPRFKAEYRFHSVAWPTDGDGCRFKPEVGRVYLQGVGDRKVTAHHLDEGPVKTISVKGEVAKWMLAVRRQYPGPAARPLDPTGEAVGVDVGVVSFAVTSDGSWVQFCSILAAKAEEAGQSMIGVDPRHTSNRCEACGRTSRENRVKQAAFRCVSCEHEAHADEHAARNILRAGLVFLTADDAV